MLHRDSSSPIPPPPAPPPGASRSKIPTNQSLTYTAGDIVVANGAKQAVYQAVLAVVRPGDEVIVPAPYWPSYPEVCNEACGTCGDLLCSRKSKYARISYVPVLTPEYDRRSKHAMYFYISACQLCNEHLRRSAVLKNQNCASSCCYLHIYCFPMIVREYARKAACVRQQGASCGSIPTRLSRPPKGPTNQTTGCRLTLLSRCYLQLRHAHTSFLRVHMYVCMYVVFRWHAGSNNGFPSEWPLLSYCVVTSLSSMAPSI